MAPVFGFSLDECRKTGCLAPYHYFTHYADSAWLRAHPSHSFALEALLIRALHATGRVCLIEHEDRAACAAAPAPPPAGAWAHTGRRKGFVSSYSPDDHDGRDPCLHTALMTTSLPVKAAPPAASFLSIISHIDRPMGIVCRWTKLAEPGCVAWGFRFAC